MSHRQRSAGRQEECTRQGRWGRQGEGEGGKKKEQGGERGRRAWERLNGEWGGGNVGDRNGGTEQRGERGWGLREGMEEREERGGRRGKAEWKGRQEGDGGRRWERR